MSQLTTLQFDIYQRYAALAVALEAAFPSPQKGVRVLDLGSGPDSITRLFLSPRFEITAADVGDFRNPAVVQLKPGEALPFPNAGFHVVVCMDVLEHVTPTDRARFLGEVARVASKAAVVAFPHDEER